MNLSELGKTSLVQHDIKLDDMTPFKEWYQRIPLHQYEEVKKHLHEMLEIGAIYKSTSPWASPIVPVSKMPEEHIQRLRGVFEKLSVAGF